MMMKPKYQNYPAIRPSINGNARNPDLSGRPAAYRHQISDLRKRSFTRIRALLTVRSGQIQANGINAVLRKEAPRKPRKASFLFTISDCRLMS